MLMCGEQVLSLTKELVKVQSVVNTLGEQKVAKLIFRHIAEMPYFQQHPEQVCLQQTLEDDQERFNVLAYVKGTKESTNKTVVLMGHTDTVGIDDFDRLKQHACDPDNLLQALKHENLPPKVKQQLDSGNWLFGRGVLDMKAGVAANLYLLGYYAEHPEKLAGNIVFVGECDEEDGSHGILSVLKLLKHWQDENQFEYIAGINTDFVSARYEGDENRYIYKGTVGKLLPSFYITGAETHVGSCFEGFDPNFLAAELTRQIDYNPDLCDQAFGETPAPPVSLKQTDL
ncbi:MAG TPA: M20/M25/M40 family metallo-hydrolase, partial [Candidatus Deferrimicrobium sp.]|nr:M20/M25/M40 family metallo-hydrolase [Candidatus Deferrimicrobium sp.]